MAEVFRAEAKSLCQQVDDAAKLADFLEYMAKEKSKY